MIDIDEVEEILDELAEELPQKFYDELNGGILLLPDTKYSPYAKNNDLYILGTYKRSASMGRLIEIYYGSFEKMFGYMDREQLKVKLREVLRHEFRHHIESLAGERGLEIEDEKFINEYLGRQK